MNLSGKHANRLEQRKFYSSFATFLSHEYDCFNNFFVSGYVQRRKKKKKRKKKLLKTIRTDLIRTYIIWDKMKNILQGETLEENISRKLLLAVWLSLWLLSHIKRIVQHIKMCGNRNFCFNAHICMHTNMYCLNI